MQRAYAVPVSLFLAGAVAACGGSTTGGAASGSVSGTVAGAPLKVASVVAVPGYSSETTACFSDPDGGTTCAQSSFSREIAVLFTNRADATCSIIQQDVASNTSFQFANLDYLVVVVNVANGDVVPGTYAVSGTTDSVTTGASAEYMISSATCATETSLSASSGTVTLSQVSGTSVTGTYAVTFGAQGSFSGSFDAALCAFDAGSSGTTTALCRP